MRTLACLFLGSVLLVSAGVAADQKTERPRQNQNQNQNQNQSQIQSMSPDMRRAIEFERAKARADARQARIEARHPTVFYNNEPRSTDQNSANRVVDPGPRVKK
jgi:hypothetical protein